MAFIHRLVVVGFVVAFLIAAFVVAGSHTGDKIEAILVTGGVLGSGFAGIAYLLTWLVRGSLKA